MDYNYEKHEILADDILSYLNVDQDGEVVSAETWCALWRNAFTYLNKHEVALYDVYTELEADAEAIAEFSKWITFYENGCVWYGEDEPTDPLYKLWVKPSTIETENPLRGPRGPQGPDGRSYLIANYVQSVITVPAVDDEYIINPNLFNRFPIIGDQFVVLLKLTATYNKTWLAVAEVLSDNKAKLKVISEITGAVGPAGPAGPDGATGAPGVSITTAYTHEDGDLFVELSDGSVVFCGNVMGPAGPAGPAGETDVPKTTSLLKGDGAGGVSEAVANVNYATPSMVTSITIPLQSDVNSILTELPNKQNVSNMVSEITSDVPISKYPSAKAVYDFVKNGYELIESITIDSATSARSINRTKEPDDTPYNFESVYVEVVAQTGTQTNGSLFVNDKVVASVLNMIHASYVTSTGFVAINYHGRILGFGAVSLGNVGNVNVSMLGGFGSFSNELDRIRSVTVNCVTNVNIPVGTTIKIYAVR